MNPSESIDLENPGLSPMDRKTLTELRKQAPPRSRKDSPERDTEAFLRTIPLDADIRDFLGAVGHETLLTANLGEIDAWERDKHTTRISPLKRAATAILDAAFGVRLAIGECIFVGDDVADPEWLALLGIAPCSLDKLARAKAAYTTLAAGVCN